ncbi:DUF2971 domain-containing protein [Lachnospiraceae bacterium TM07-2AC]|nr:DUF2971 domain-containing protein [Lachnospiraceae bacterium TM07-2AC]
MNGGKMMVEDTKDMAQIEKEFCVGDDEEIIRYMSLSKFMSLLTFKELFFTNVKVFEDAHEGEIPASFFKGWNENFEEGYKNIQSHINPVRNVYANCWNKFNGQESYALWKIYTDEDSGVAIKTTVGKLKKALNNKKIKVYEMKYIDSFENKNISVRFPKFEFHEVLSPLREVYKIKPYSYEEEIRALFLEISDEEPGKMVEIDLNELIETVYVSPFAKKWFSDLIRETIKKYGLNKEVAVKHSKIPVRK